MSEPFPVNGQRVVLRRLVAADLPAFQQYRSDDDSGRYQGWSPMSDADAAEFIARMGAAAAFQPGEWLQVAIAARSTGRLVGDIGLHLSADAGEAELGFTLQRSAQGQGMATEAVRLAIDVAVRTDDGGAYRRYYRRPQRLLDAPSRTGRHEPHTDTTGDVPR